MENKLGFFFRHQIWHLGGTIVLFYIGAQFVDLESNTNTLIGLSALSWFMIAMSIPLIHQAYVWICWRSELCWKSITNTIGFKGYVILFFILIISRLSAIVLCFVDYGSLYTQDGLLGFWQLLFLFQAHIPCTLLRNILDFYEPQALIISIQNIEIYLLKKEVFLNGLQMQCMFLQ